MKTRMLLVITTSLLFLFSYAGCSDKPANLTYGKAQALSEAKPKKPVRIKVHRNAKGEYSWDLTGDDPDEVAKADKKLRKAMGLQ
ncbi:MAG: hypothetical protein LLF86_05135 [Nitrospiraceae bacterium]|nr:hypothetical protein [Nitrospiraceae bacterium]